MAIPEIRELDKVSAELEEANLKISMLESMLEFNEKKNKILQEIVDNLEHVGTRDLTDIKENEVPTSIWLKLVVWKYVLTQIKKTYADSKTKLEVLNKS